MNKIYFIGKTILGTSVKVSEQCAIAASNGNKIVWLFSKDMYMLNKAIVWIHLEYCI